MKAARHLDSGGDRSDTHKRRRSKNKLDSQPGLLFFREDSRTSVQTTRSLTARRRARWSGRRGSNLPTPSALASSTRVTLLDMMIVLPNPDTSGTARVARPEGTLNRKEDRRAELDVPANEDLERVISGGIRHAGRKAGSKLHPASLVPIQHPDNLSGQIDPFLSRQVEPQVQSLAHGGKSVGQDEDTAFREIACHPGHRRSDVASSAELDHQRGAHA